MGKKHYYIISKDLCVDRIDENGELDDDYPLESGVSNLYEEFPSTGNIYDSEMSAWLALKDIIDFKSSMIKKKVGDLFRESR